MSTTEKARKTDRRVLRTRKAIMSAFETLISQGNADKITVSAIAREADIDRKTFYLHYTSVDDLANHKMIEALERVIDQVKIEGEGKTGIERVHITLEEVNAIIMSDVALYSSIASRLSVDQALERLDNAIKPAFIHSGIDIEFMTDQQLHMFLQFFVVGACSLYLTWLKSDRTEPIETVSTIIENAVMYSAIDAMTSLP